jgi:medium-chain acyl-[acyl-carrier-protein] hydrolase
MLIVSARRAPQIPLRRAPTWDLGEADFVRELRRLQGTPEEILSNTELMQLFMPQLRSDFQMEETYLHPLDYPQLTCPIVAFGGLHDKDVTEPDLLSWNAVTRAGAKLQRVFNSGHFYIHTHTRELVREIKGVLTTVSGVGPVPMYPAASSRAF